MPKEIEVRVRKAIADRVFPGCVIGIVRSDGAREIVPFGTFTYETDAKKVTAETIYDLASVTKSIPLASLAALFIQENRCNLSDKVKTYVPELQNDYGATIEDVLRYRVQGPRLSQLQYETFEQIRTHIFEHGFSGPPDDSSYSNMPAYVLGIVIERVGGALLPALAETYLFGPLKMHDTTFFPHDIARCAPTEIVEHSALHKEEEIRGIVHDESARTFFRARRAVGHAGLFSTAPDMLNFLQALLQGKLPAVREGAQKGLGWQIAQPFWMGSRESDSAFGKTGFTGTSVLVDPQKNTGLVILSNRTYPRRTATQDAINTFRSDIADIVLR